MKLRALSIWMVTTLILSGASFVSAGDYHGKGHGHGPNGGRHDKMKEEMQEIMQDLDLTEDQQAKLAELREQGHEQKTEMHQKKREFQKQIKEELDKPESDQAVLNNLADELAAVHKEMIMHRINKVLDMKKVLTEDQYAALKYKMDVKREARKELRKMRREQHRKMGSPDEEFDGPEAPPEGPDGDEM